MRYPKDHKEQVRAKLLAQSGSYAKKHGFAASGVDTLAAAAGLTTGSLYKHFANKTELFAELIRNELGRSERFFGSVPPGDRAAMLEALSRYLGMEHVELPELGCPLPTLAAEVARADDAVRDAFETGLVQIKDVIQNFTGSESAAWAVIAQNVGAVMIARAVRQAATRQAVLQAAHDASVRYLPDESI